MAREPRGWIHLEIPEEVSRLAAERCRGYSADPSRTLEELMRDCWIQGFLDRSFCDEQLRPLLAAEEGRDDGQDS